MSNRTTSTTSDHSIDGSNDGWGWDASVQEETPPSPSISIDEVIKPVEEIHAPKTVKSLKSFDSKQYALRASENSLKTGMTSSPSFQELEKAIGATLALSMNGSESDMQTILAKASGIPKIGSFHTLYQRAQNQSKLKRSNSDWKTIKEELSDFIRESESRAIILFHNPEYPVNSIREACQKIGPLYYIRPEFHNRGVTFLSYFDLRCATTAIGNLSKELGSASASAHYSIMLHGTANNAEEHRLVVKNLPPSIPESELHTIFKRYGEVISIERKQSLDRNDNAQESPYVYLVEYFNIQDSRSAASELCATSSQMWGPTASITYCPISQPKQILLRQLLGILSKWRTENTSVGPSLAYHSRIPTYTFPQNSGPFSNNFSYNLHLDATIPNIQPPQRVFAGMSFQPPDVLAHALPTYYPKPFQTHSGLPENGFSTTMPIGLRSGTSIDQRFYPNQSEISRVARMNIDLAADFRDNKPHHHNNNGLVNHSVRRPKSGNSSLTNPDSEFILDVNRIGNNTETRTTVMVRNIPNKYTQRMLLDEVDVNHMGTYDFFYLPIDFKNKCNVGYCFINFLEPSHIIAFVEEFHGQRWKNFNSEKVCAVTYARIQGKMAMISRFQNSNLLEKHDDYRPLLFYSSGPDKGKLEPFPVNKHKPHSNLKSDTSNMRTTYVEQSQAIHSYEVRDNFAEGYTDHGGI